ncbi:glycerol-3-phosphate 1-O-acyltransferase PlsY [Mucisphaera calidilacus]|uniref:Glycerol-3-phosphate acyltransferase n=1 Tax=Mucisphaera calidilacus TaxID=2527982 RepID=A0A518BYC9_9BACT|nr:glycerol-3-phosphate 1-O-acyltransferase PlsY [Mucisphaera calidilacus]QDU71981.1 Glycerol-3-phosphate acyltransferase [Mucisphaera calidilacus]
MSVWIWMVLGYLCGSIPFGLLLGWARGVDIRRHGSGNIGATNAGRVLGRRMGLICFGLDLAKGLLPVLAFSLLGEREAGFWGALSGMGVAVSAMAGHILPVWLKFKGGKGVATGLGVMLGLWPVVTLPAVVAGVAWVGVTWFWGYVSLGSVVAAGLLPVLAVASGVSQGLSASEIGVYGVVTGALGVMVIVRHKGNMARIRSGTEPRVGWSRRGERPSA